MGCCQSKASDKERSPLIAENLDRRERAVSEREEEVTRRERALDEARQLQEHHVRSVQESLNARDAAITQREEAVTEREAQLEKRDEVLRRKEALLDGAELQQRELSVRLVELQEAQKQRDAAIARAELIATKLQEEIDEIRAALHQSKAQASQATNEKRDLLAQLTAERETAASLRAQNLALERYLKELQEQPAHSPTIAVESEIPKEKLVELRHRLQEVLTRLEGENVYLKEMVASLQHELESTVHRFDEERANYERKIEILKQGKREAEEKAAASGSSGPTDTAHASQDGMIAFYKEKINKLNKTKERMSATLRELRQQDREEERQWLEKKKRKREKYVGPPVFGSSLEELVEYQKRFDTNSPDYPVFLSALIHALSSLPDRGELQLMHSTCDPSRVHTLREEFESTGTLSTATPQELAALLKAWLEDLKDPLLPPEVAVACRTNELTSAAATTMVTQLAPVRKATLAAIIDFLRQLSNPDTEGLLVDDFAPALFRGETTDAEKAFVKLLLVATIKLQC